MYFGRTNKKSALVVVFKKYVATRSYCKYVYIWSSVSIGTDSSRFPSPSSFFTISLY